MRQLSAIICAAAMAATTAAYAGNLIRVPVNDASIAAAASGPPPAALRVQSHAFGVDDVDGYNTASIGLTVTNTGSGPASGIAFSLPGTYGATFRNDGTTCTGTLAPAATCTVWASLRAGTEGFFAQTFTATSTEGASTTFSLYGVGNYWTSGPSVTPSTDAGTVPLNTPIDFPVTVGNSSYSAQIDATTTLGAEFSIVADTCVGQTIPNAGSCTITVRFAGSATRGLHAGAVRLQQLGGYRYGQVSVTVN